MDPNDEADMNNDGSVDLYIGPQAPAGKEKNWIQTDPDNGCSMFSNAVFK